MSLRRRGELSTLFRASLDEVHSLHVLGSAGDDTLEVDCSNGRVPVPEGGLMWDGREESTAWRTERMPIADAVPGKATALPSEPSNISNGGGS